MMFTTTGPIQWLLYFYIYCFLGWVFESCYVSIRQHRWVNRGFLRGPFLPIYGSGAVMMLVVSEPFRDSLVLTYFAGVVGATLLEYVTGAALEAIFKVRYWDYSNQKFNINGHICLSSSIAWGFFTIGMNEFLHPAILAVFAPVPVLAQGILTCAVSIYFTVDTVVSVKDALDLRDVLIKIEEAKEEMERLQKRVDVVLAFADEQMNEFKEAHPQFMKLEERKNALRKYSSELREWLEEIRVKGEEKLAEISERGEQKLAEMSERGEQKLAEMSERGEQKLAEMSERNGQRFAEMAEKEEQNRKDMYLRQLSEIRDIEARLERMEESRRKFRESRSLKHRRKFRGNPSMRAPKHEEAFEMLRDMLARK